MNPSALLFELLVEASLCLAVFTLFYLAVLRNLTHYQGKRLFILVAFACSLTIAGTHIEVVHVTDTANASTLTLEQLFPQITALSDAATLHQAGSESATPTLMDQRPLMVLWLVGAGSLLFLGHFLWQWRSLKRQLRHARAVPGEPNVFESDRIASAFSFAGKVYVPTAFRELPEEEWQQVLAHEQAHIRLRHNWDVLLLGGLKALFWFHPCYWLLSRELRANHEFQVDQLVTATRDRAPYSELLLKLNGAQRQSAITSYFAQHLIKKRVMKLHQHPSSPMKKPLFALALPLALALFYAFSVDTVYQSNATANAPEPTPAKPFILPVPASAITKTAPFGPRQHPISATRKMHKGIDLVVPLGTEVVAAADGQVIATENNTGGYGIKVKLAHADSLFTTYAHLQRYTVQQGDMVRQGDIIGYAGNSGKSTGPHLHFEVIKGEEFVDPELHLLLAGLDPELYDQTVDREALVVILDAGHGGEDAGNAEGPISEKALTLQYAKTLRQKLEYEGVEVLLVRADDRFVPLSDRAAFTQGRTEALFISLHLNAAKASSANGFEVYIPNNERPTYRKSLRFANVADRILTQNGVETRGVKTANFSVLANSESPAVLMELGFLSSPKDMEKLQSETYREQLCGWIAKAVGEYAR